MKIVFMGTPDFAVPALEKLIEKHEVLCVVTKEDKEHGRGRKVKFSAVKEVALANKLPLFQPKRIKSKDSIEFLKTFEGVADVFVVIAYGQILSKEILDIPKLACLNIHGSILPKYRGAAPIHHAIINGEKETGATIMYMDEGMDTGDIIKVTNMPICDNDTLGTIYDKMCNDGANALIEVLNDFEKGIFNRTKQDDTLATYAPMIKKEDGRLDFNKNAVELFNLVRGLNPMPSGFFTHNGLTFKVHSLDVVDGDTKKECGEVLFYDKNNGLVINTTNGAISIKTIQKQGSKAMDIKAFINGNKDVFIVNEKI
ncbi:MAG: methionyl-tRNA formyltransferase [Lachnospirales bacterium]